MTTENEHSCKSSLWTVAAWGIICLGLLYVFLVIGPQRIDEYVQHPRILSNWTRFLLGVIGRCTTVGGYIGLFFFYAASLTLGIVLRKKRSIRLTFLWGTIIMVIICLLALMGLY